MWIKWFDDGDNSGKWKKSVNQGQNWYDLTIDNSCYIGAHKHDGSDINSGMINVDYLPSSVALEDAANVFVTGQYIGSNSGAGVLNLNGAYSSEKGIKFRDADTLVGQLLITSGNQVLDGPGSLSIRTGGSTNRLVITSTGQLTERNRSTPIGEWISPSTSGVLKTDSGSLSDIVWSTYAYTLIGKTMIISFWVTFTVTSGTYNVTIDIPGGFTSNRAMLSVAQIKNNSVNEAGNCQAGSGATILRISRFATTPVLSGSCAVYGQIAFEVQ